MSDLYPTPNRLALLRDVEAGRVYWSTVGRKSYPSIREPRQVVTATVREAEKAGWVELANTCTPARRYWMLTDAGRAILAGGGR